MTGLRRELFLAGAAAASGVACGAIATVHANGTGSLCPPSGQQPADCGRPAGETSVPHGGVHLRREAALQAPTIQRTGRLGKKPACRPGDKRGPRRGRFLDLRRSTVRPIQVWQVAASCQSDPAMPLVDPQGFQRTLASGESDCMAARRSAVWKKTLSSAACASSRGPVARSGQTGRRGNPAAK